MEPSGASPEKIEAARSLAIALKLLAAHDLVGSKRFAERAISTDPELADETADQILAVADVVLSSQNSRVGNHPDWYSILHLPRPNPNFPPSAPSDTSNLLKRHYRRLALLLHPDRNKLPGADDAFQLVVDAYIVLSDPSRKSLFDAELRISDVGPPAHISGSGSGSASASASFWTTCPFCCHVHQYPRSHQGRNLLCQTCRRGFDAVEMRAPPPVVPGTDTYVSTWGFFPLGFPASLDSDWKPFVPMFPWTAGAGGGGEDGSHLPRPPPTFDRHAVPPSAAAAAALSGKGKKKMARKRVGNGLRKKVFASGTQNRSVADGNGDARSEEEEEVVAAATATATAVPKGIDMNEEAKAPEGAVEDLEMLIDLDAADDVLGNLHNLPFLRDEDIHIHFP